jgi:predicted alpha-1,2-mannosidase
MKNLQARRLPFAICLAVLMASVVTPTSAVTAQSANATTDFFSSFEASDPQPDWVNTSEVDADGNKKTSGVTGSPVTGIPGNITDRIVEVQANGENPPNELAANVFDGNVNTKWLVFQPTGWVWGKLDEPVTVVHYALTSANDAPERDPRDWTLEGSQDGQTWTILDTQTDQLFDSRFQTKDYRFENTSPYLYYRLNITRNRSGGATTIVQLAELQLSDGDTTPPPPTDMKTFVTGGPVNGFNHRPNVGFTGVQSLQYSGGQISEDRGYAYNKVFDVDILVTPASELSYLIFPELTANDLDYPSTYAGVDLAFSDGTYLSDLGARDQHDAELSPQGQGESKTLYTDQWNYKVARIGGVAAGKTIDRILVAYDSPTGVGLFNGWVDDIRIVGSPIHETPDRLSDHVDTRRGTHSSGGYSRGNNIPATAVPHGFNFWVPMTNAGSTSWLYEYHRQNNAQNLPMLQAFAVSHEPSPWMGDRQTFQVMPSASAATPPDGGRSSRALAFRHENEVAKPHYYGVTFENGIKTEVAPSDHAAMLRFTFTGDTSTLIFDNVNNQASLNLDAVADGVITGYSDVRSGLSTGATRMYMYATFDEPITASGRPSGVGNRTAAAGWARFDTSGDRAVTMRVATSLISVAQARHNLELEISASDTFEQVTERAGQAWDDKLSVIEVEGASADQLTTLYSNLYRLFLYPNSAFENSGTNDEPVYRHAVQSSTSTPPSGPTQTGAPVVDGKVYVNNGFWDTYRTTWPAYALLTPSMAGEMVDGFVQQYKDGGWIARWSSPGYANLMVGTSSDVAFADSYLKGVTDFDVQAAYDAAIKNATVNPPNQNVGRKGFTTSPFLGYTSVQSTDEAMSWAMDGYINDFGIANMAKALFEATGEARYAEHYEYFVNRAQNYVNMFDPNVGFFQGRNADGSWRVPPDTFDPRVWGFDYTETNAWNMAFHVPQDGRGLANLYGGTDALADKLDEFFSTPETAGFPGSYGGIIHEMREARDVRMGQYGHSNQPSHHIVYMYDYVGQPWKTQENAREALSRLYIGSEIGQGYPGDEDNGEMSAWQVFSALGFYPLQMGSPFYAIGSPLFTKATVHLENGEDIIINAPNNDRDNLYVQGLKVNGEEYDKTYLPHEQLAEGAVLDFAMGPAPSQWGTGEDAAPPSITDDADVPRPLQDATGAGRGAATASENTNAAGLFDNTSATRVSLAGDDSWVQYGFRENSRQLIRFYTLTSGEGDATADPRSWVLKGSNDGRSWTVLDQRSGETFPWRTQTRPFKVTRPSNFSQYRIEFTDNGGGVTTRLAEVELLTSNKPLTSPLSAEVEGAVAWPGDTVTVRVTVSNSGDAPATGEVAASVLDGWSVEPATSSFGPIAGGESETVTFEVTVPEGTQPGAYPVEVSVTSSRGPATSTADVQVIGDVIEFTPDTAAEEPWLFDADASQLDGAVFDGHARFTDGERYVIYRFQLPSAVAGGTLTLDIGNQFLVKVSTDGASWRTVLEETQNIRDLSNRQERALDLNELRGDGRDLYVWIGDSQTQDGWGAWLARLKLEMLSE